MQPTQPTLETRLHFLDYWRVVKSRWMLVFSILLLVLLAAAVFTYFQPKEYQAQVRIKVEQERPTVAVFERQSFPTYDPYFLQTQYEIIQSRKILYPVIERLGLVKKWGREGVELPMDLAFKRLKSQITVRRSRDTSLIEIAVVDTDPRFAASVANLTAEVFERERMEVKREETMRGIKKLREGLEAQLARVHQVQAEVERLRKDLNVPMFGTVKLSDLQIQQLEQQLGQARVEAVSSEARLGELKKLTPAQLRNTPPSLINDPNVTQLIQDLIVAERKMEELKQDYGPDHPTVRTTQATVEKLQDQLNGRIAGIVHSYEVEHQVAQARVTELTAQLEKVKQFALALESDKLLPFRNAQRDEEMELKMYEVIKQRLQQESVELELPRSPVEVIDTAEAPAFPVRPRMGLNLVLGAVAGLALGITLAFFLEFLDTSVKRIEDVESYLGLPVLGVVPQRAGFIGRGEATPADVEAYRVLRTNLEFAVGTEYGNSFCVVSAAPGEGKSFTASNLACVYAQHGSRVLVVDCDLRRPRIDKIFAVNNEAGLADFLVGATAADAVILATSIPNVYVLPAGSAANGKTAIPMLSSHRMQELVNALRAHFDIVLYDTPPVLGVSETAVLARDVGQSFMVIQHRRYPRHMSRRARQIIDQSGGKLLGVLINSVEVTQADTFFYYHHQYEDYLRAPDTRRGTAQPAAGPGPKGGDEIQLAGKY